MSLDYVDSFASGQFGGCGEGSELAFDVAHRLEGNVGDSLLGEMFQSARQCCAGFVPPRNPTTLEISALRRVLECGMRRK